MVPGESSQEFLHVIKRLLAKAIPEMDGAREQLLLHRFLSGIPEQFSKSIRASPDVHNTSEALKRVKLLTLCQRSEITAAISDSSTTEAPSLDKRLNQLEEKLNRVLTNIKEVGEHSSSHTQRCGSRYEYTLL